MTDIGDVTVACQDREISRWTSAIPWPYDEDDARGWISSHDDLWERGEEAPFAIVAREDGRLLGSAGLILIEDRPPAAGYWVANWERNHGVATRALQILTRWGFDSLGLDELTLVTMLGNVASERVAEKAGYLCASERAEYRPPRNPEQTYSVKEWVCHRRPN